MPSRSACARYAAGPCSDPLSQDLLDLVLVAVEHALTGHEENRRTAGVDVAAIHIMSESPLGGQRPGPVGDAKDCRRVLKPVAVPPRVQPEVEPLVGNTSL